MHADDRTPAPVSVLGLGLMGRALAEALVRDGHPTTVWNRTAAKAEPLAAQGATVAASPREAVTAAPLVVLCVTDYAAARALLEPLTDALDGRVVVNLGSGTSEAARDLGAWTARHGGGYLDGAIMAVPAGIGTADAAVVYSGPRPDFDRYEAVLRSFTPVTTHLGEDPGLASLHETAVLSLMWSILNGFLQGAALLGTAGVTAAAYAPIAERAAGTVTGWLAGYAQQIDDGAYPPLDSTLDTHLAAMEHLIHESEFLGVNAELPHFVKALADRAVAAGHGGDGYAALVEQFRKPSGNPPVT